MRISVLGTGYLGATHAACLASIGHTVVGVDRDADRVRELRAGQAPFHEPGLDRLLRACREAGRLRFSGDLTEAADAEVHFLCVGTPQVDGSGHADLSALWSITDQLAPLLDRPCLVVGKSTVPVGTAWTVRRRLQARAPAGGTVSLAWNPEFLREGRAVEDSLRPHRLVLGVESDEDYQILLEVYADLLSAHVPVIRTDLQTAELAKVSANAMLAARLSMVNLLAEVCEVSAADVAKLTEVLGSDPRIGGDFLQPGLGYGGGCLPKDTRAFVARAQELGVRESVRLLEAVDAVNLRQRERTAALAWELIEEAGSDRRVTVLGGAFKAESDDVRDSPALDVAVRLQTAGARVRVYDPRAAASIRRAHPCLSVSSELADACRGADLLLVGTEWAEFAGVDPVALRDLVRRPVALDARRVLDAEKWVAAGWDFHALGRGRMSAPPGVAAPPLVSSSGPW